MSAVHRLLTNPYYIGIVHYRGKSSIGRHDPLVDRDTFDRVQSLLLAGRHGERASKHDHFLRGTVVCSECKGRLLYGRHRGRNGTYYEYFSCVNRASRGRGPTKCRSGHYSVPQVERKIEQLYEAGWV